MTHQIKHHHSFHFIGVGGIGMSALAVILSKRGHAITGSDHRNSQTLKKLEAQGVKIFQSQTKSNIRNLCKNKGRGPLIIVSSAIPTNNPELLEAQKANLKILHRSDLLAALMNQQASIAVAGTHGKTTTSSLITTLLALTQQDPSAVIGGLVPYYSSNCHAGKGRFLIAEADESDGTLVKLKAELGLITNIELDHTDHYANLDDLIQTMEKFGNGCKNLLANYDCQHSRKHLSANNWWSITTEKEINFAGLPVSVDGNQTIANFYENGEFIDQLKLPIPGLHNLSNTIAAIGACRICGVPFQKLQEAIPYLKNPGRRFEYRGSWKGRHIVDDYAHHPSEIKATLKTAHLMLQSSNSILPSVPKRIVVAFQPHRYSRTQEFLRDFAEVLGNANHILLAPIYEAGETAIPGIDSENLAKAIKAIYPNLPVTVANSLEDLIVLLKKISLEKDLVISMGAGNITSLWERLTTRSDTNQCLPDLAA